ncbi:hypothetical protein GGI12_005617 [Dipsacomyces acuminosporus]|nr:hypothetical protein GGI12_005617 [Dipsacomyces acuminosporus]
MSKPHPHSNHSVHNHDLYYAVFDGHYKGVFTCKDDYNLARFKRRREGHRIYEQLHDAESYIGMGGDPYVTEAEAKPMVIYIGSVYRVSRRGRHWVGYSAYFGNDDSRNIAAKLGMHETPSVHRGELLAIKRVVGFVGRAAKLAQKAPRPLHIFTVQKGIEDSLGRQCLKWMENGWTRTNGKPVAHQDVMKDILKLMNEHEIDLIVKWVPRASGALGNQRARDLAWHSTF